jgi:acetyl-CoA carboxylase biotin carboxyl carrier protein
MAQEDMDLKKIKELIDVMKDNDLAELEIKHGDDKIMLKRTSPQQPTMTAIPTYGHQEASPGAPAAAKDDGLIDIKSPIVGTFYAKPSPDSEPFVEIGSHVTPETVVCIIEAMKVMNEIKSEVSGTVVKIQVTNGQAVEYGQVLYKVKPN